MDQNKKNCVSLVTNDAFFDKMLYTLNGIISKGYGGDICVVIGDDLINSEKLKTPVLQNVIIKHFPDIKFSDNFITNFNSIDRGDEWRKKIFQYHKFYMFDTFFKQWEYVFYLDSGISVFSSLKPILDSSKPNKFLAHSDAYPDYQWKLSTQFVSNNEIYTKLSQKYNLNIDYPQSTIMLYDTDIIKEDTFNNLINLAEEYSISKTNDQGIIALYFTLIQNCWEQISLENDNVWFYDYLLRPNKCNKPHILLKML
jgi:hypothetical protein